MVEWSQSENDDAGASNGGGEADGRELSINAEQLGDLPGTKRSKDQVLDIGDVFELLKNERRRRVIRFLKSQEDGVTTLNVVAEHIAALENDIDVSQLSSSQRKRVYIGLYQCHLPKMDDFGVIDFQKDRGIITLQNTAELEPFLQKANEVESTDWNGPDGSADGEHHGSTGEVDDDEVDTADDGADTADGRSDLFAASAIAIAVGVGVTGIGPLVVVPTALWTAFSLVALLWFARK